MKNVGADGFLNPDLEAFEAYLYKRMSEIYWQRWDAAYEYELLYGTGSKSKNISGLTLDISK